MRAEHIRLFGRCDSAFTNMDLARLHNQGLPMPDIDANGTHVRRQYVAASIKRISVLTLMKKQVAR